MGYYANTEIVYGYRVNLDEFDWDTFAEEYENIEDIAEGYENIEDIEADYGSFQEFFCKNVFDEYYHIATIYGENYPECFVIGIRLGLYDGVEIFDANLKITDEQKQEIAKMFKEKLPFIPEREAHYYILTSYD